MWDAVPIEHFLLLLRSDAVIFVHEVEECALRLFKGCIGARLQVTKVGKDSLLEFFRILHGSSKCLETE